MKPDRKKVVEIFSAALQLTTEEELDEFLSNACAGDDELHEKVVTLLEAYAEGDINREKLSASSGDLQEDTLVASIRRAEVSGTMIDRYKLLERLGEGGMGTVWMAEQTEPVQRRVALKVIKHGMDSGNVLARFEAERQALALMDHANIAKVFDAGTTSSGRPYFVMELVKGIPITTFCDDKRLSIHERLELFMPVCQAIQHAHQKGIIHRDIKPSNVLVALYDGEPAPKVIDFGVAKATGQRLTQRTLFTELGALVGTPEYMSPEQAELNQLDIDTRSDIYSLGVLLYELLTGTTPIPREAFREAAFDEILRRIREDEPPKPSTRLNELRGYSRPVLRARSESKEDLSTISAQRKLQPLQLTKLVRGDLDWIVMKALEKSRTRRYVTANELSQDISHHLNEEPVNAGPPTFFYKAHKLLRRRRREFLTAASVLMLLIGVFAGAVQWRQAKSSRQARELAEMRREEWQLLGHVIAGVTVNATDKERVQTCVSRLAERVKMGHGSDLDHVLLARFLTRCVFLRSEGRIQEMEHALLSLVSDPNGDYPVKGLGVILFTPRVTINGKEFRVEYGSRYLGGQGGGTYAVTLAEVGQFVVRQGSYEFSGVLEVQLVHAKSPEIDEAEATVEDYQSIGQRVPIFLPVINRTFIRKLPAEYPPEVADDQLWRTLREGLVVEAADFTLIPTGMCEAHIALSVPRLSSPSLRVALACRLIQVGEENLALDLIGVHLDAEKLPHVVPFGRTGPSGGRVEPEAQRFKVEAHWRFTTPSAWLRLKEDNVTVTAEFGFRSSRTVARMQDFECFLAADGEIKNACPITIRRISPP